MLAAAMDRYEFSSRWAERGRANWREHLADLAGKPLVYLEIGVFEGRSGCWVLDEFLTHPNSRYIGIDLWQYTAKHDGRIIEARARKNLGRHPGKVELIKGDSNWVFRHPRWLPASIDIGYIDGDHGAAAVLNDSVLLWPLIKPGGILIWDDYARRRRNSVRQGMNSFLSCISGRYELVFISRQQLAVRKLESQV